MKGLSYGENKGKTNKKVGQFNLIEDSLPSVFSI